MKHNKQGATNIPEEQFKANLDTDSYTIPDGTTQIGEGNLRTSKPQRNYYPR